METKGKAETNILGWKKWTK